MSRLKPLQTGQTKCYDQDGNEIPCEGAGQDGTDRFGLAWPDSRFEVEGDVVQDRLTGLGWTKNANLNEFPLTWQESLDYVKGLNDENLFGHGDWRLPNRRELHSLMAYGTRKPALPAGHPFENYFLGWYWTSTSAAINPAYAWYLHLEGARMFYGRKDQYYLVWPVRGEGSSVLARSGQVDCYDEKGGPIDCTGTGQDGEYRLGVSMPAPRFVAENETVADRLTGLVWLKDADLTKGPVSWREALAAVEELNRVGVGGRKGWRLPNIRVLEALIDCSRSSPALPEDNPFINLGETYWSSTTSFFETDWAWALYLEKGALGVGFKKDRGFHVWPVSMEGVRLRAG
ncbi:MAG: DUF1566 domain-containing protein [Desulfurivibrionaceae bacterium]